MNKDKVPNYYDVSDDEEVNKADKQSPSQENGNKGPYQEDNDKYHHPNKKKEENKHRQSHSHSRRRSDHYHSKRHLERSRHKHRRHQSRSRSQSDRSQSSSRNNSRHRSRKRKCRKYSFSSSSYSSSSFISSHSTDRRPKDQLKASNSNPIKTAFENEFEANSNRPIPKWSSPARDNNIKTIKLLKNKKIEVIMQNQYKAPSTKEKPNFSASGLLAKQTNTQNGVVLKYTTPQDAGSPLSNWRLYEFHKESAEPQFIHRLNGMDHFLIGKDTRVSSIILENMSSSRQHAVIQFRKKISKDSEVNTSEDIVPYVIDLESTNGTMLNKEKINPSVYYELKHEDVLNFGDENTDYVVMAL